MNTTLTGTPTVPVLVNKATVLPAWFFSLMLILPFTGSAIAVPMMLNVTIFTVTSAMLATRPVMGAGLTMRETQRCASDYAARVIVPALVLVSAAKIMLATFDAHPHLTNDLLTLLALAFVALATTWVSRGIALGGGFREIASHLMPVIVVFLVAALNPLPEFPGSLALWMIIGGIVGLAAQGAVVAWPGGAALGWSSRGGYQSGRAVALVPAFLVVSPICFVVIAGQVTFWPSVGTGQMTLLFGVFAWTLMAVLTVAGPMATLASMGLASAVGLTRRRWARTVITRCGASVLLSLGASLAVSTMSQSWWPVSATAWACVVVVTTLVVSVVYNRLAHMAVGRGVAIGMAVAVSIVPAVSLWAIPSIGETVVTAAVGVAVCVIMLAIYWVHSAKAPVSASRLAGGSS